ncbi:hypothetical protein AVEN_80902-1 [Araneus ventricosus]|uniref:Uncharacterized protein n=1 Tax=Araneus ventricosus TaxID=182803 RepID=A0A4Y2DN57_ARAVE|nr:hypothetical protein AVEN_80902-1 [Araneus ventricosus]
MWNGSLEKKEPVQEPSLSSDHGSKLRSPLQNSPRVDSKRNVNLTKLKYSIRKCRKYFKKSISFFIQIFIGHDGHVIESRLWVSRHNSTEDPPCIRAWYTFNLPRVKRLPVAVVWKYGKMDAGSGVVLFI